MIPTSQIQISNHFEWDTPWSMGLLIVAILFFIGWTIWQLMREAHLAQFRWWPLFLVIRTTVGGVLAWMLLGPTAVRTQTETHPRTVAVYLDSSSSMQIHDQPEPIFDERWNAATDYQTHSVAAADKLVLFASSLRQQVARLIAAIDQQAERDEKADIAGMCQTQAGKCSEWIDSEVLKRAIPAGFQDVYGETRQLLTNEIVAFFHDKAWMQDSDVDALDQKLQRLAEQVDRMLSNCRVVANGLVQESFGQQARSISEETPTRLQRAIPVVKHGLSEWMRQNDSKYRIKLGQFSDRVTSLPLENWETQISGTDSDGVNAADARPTNLSELLRQVRDESGKEELAAAVIVTDGRQTVPSADNPRDVVAQVRVPLFLIPIGNGEMKRDVILHHVHAPNSVIQKDKILIDGIVTGYRCASETCEVKLVESNNILQTKRITFQADQDDQRFEFEVPTEQLGRRELVVIVEKLPDENSGDNNQKAIGVDVVDPSLRILVADGRARWEFQYLINLFNRQDSIEMDQLRFAPQPSGTGRRKQTKQFPKTVQEWNDYRVVILGDVSPQFLTEESQRSLREYITQRGGSLIVIAGQNDMPHSFAGNPLEDLLPVENDSAFAPDRQGYRVELTAEAKTSETMALADDLASTERIWREMSTSLPIYSISKYHKPKLSSQTFLKAVSAQTKFADAPALLCWQTVGAGRVAFLSSPTTYQLRNQNGDKYHHRFWGQLVRWIVSRNVPTGSKNVKLMADKTHFSQGDVAQLTMELSDSEGKPVVDASPSVEVAKGSNVVSSINMEADPKVPGRYRGSFAAKESDQFVVRAHGPEVERLLKAESHTGPVEIQIEFEPGLDREINDPRSDRPLMEFLAEQTGGLVLQPTAFANLPQALSLSPRVQSTSQKTPLWNRWWCLWVILGCSTVEWLIRKRVGLA